MLFVRERIRGRDKALPFAESFDDASRRRPCPSHNNVNGNHQHMDFVPEWLLPAINLDSSVEVVLMSSNLDFRRVFFP